MSQIYIHVRINYIQFTDRISDIYDYELSRLINWGLSNDTCDNSRHSAECTNADDLFGAYILSCHLVSHTKKTIGRGDRGDLTHFSLKTIVCQNGTNLLNYVGMLVFHAISHVS